MAVCQARRLLDGLQGRDVPEGVFRYAIAMPALASVIGRDGNATD